MISVLVCTHGPAAEGLIKTTEMICGEQDQCVALSFKMGQSLDEFKEQVKSQLSKFSSEILCLVDLKGGTPFNTIVTLAADYPNLEIVTGVNVPMLLETFIQRPNMPLDKLVPDIIEAGNQGIENHNAKSISDDNSGDEEF